MSSEILFNSHALSSLKRAQLIKLCKRYGIKSTGKNTELVAKLEAYGQTLPPASTFICPSEVDLLSSPSKGPYTNDSDSDDEQPHQGAGRPSDQWEPVSEADDVFAADVTIREESEEGSTGSDRTGTLGSMGSKSGRSIEEFGNKANAKLGSTGSKSSITSSLKSIASSFMRSNKPAPAPPREPTPPLPPMPAREPTPPPIQGPGPHSVRLISSPIRPPRRSRSPADLLSGVPLPSPSPNKLAADLAQIDSVLENAAGPESSPTVARVSFGFGTAGYDQDEDISMTSGTGPTLTVSGPAEDEESGNDEVPGGFPISPKPLVPLDSNSLAPPNAPFVFGSPRHSVSNTQFGDAAAAVLREMNERMGVAGASQGISIEQLQGVMANKTSAPAKPVEKKIDVRFADKHDKEFAKMDSIANHYSIASKKRKSQHESSASTSTATAAPKIFTLPPHITAPPSLPERDAKRARMSTVDGEEPSTSAGAVSGNKVLQDSPAVRNNLEKKRRSSAARGSIGGAGARKSTGGARAAAPSTSRFGFMKMVRSVWGGGKKAPEKEKEKEKETKPTPAAATKPTERKPSVGITKKFPNAPTEEPANVPNFPSAPKTKLGGIGIGRPSGIAPKAGAARSSSGVKPSIGRTSVRGDDRKSTGGTLRGAISTNSRPTSTAATTTQARQDSPSGIPAPSIRTRPTSTLFAPTAASLARQGTVSAKAGPVKPVVTTRAGTMASRTGAGAAGSRPLPVPPTGVGRAATTGAAVAGSPRVTSPPVRASSVMSPTGRSVTSNGTASGTGSVVSPMRKSMGAQAVSKAAGSQLAGRKSAVPQGMRSPGGANRPRQSIFKNPLTVDAMTMRGAAPTIQPFRLSPQGNIPVASGSRPATTAASPTSGVKKGTNTNTNTDTKTNIKTNTKVTMSTTAPKPLRRPRISRSKVIAKLGEKRAAIAATSALSPNSKARSSAHERRSLGPIAAKKALDADMDRRARARKSEAARRKSRVVASTARRSEGAVLRRDRDGDINMDI